MAAPCMEKGYGNLCQNGFAKGVWKPLTNGGSETSLNGLQIAEERYGNLEQGKVWKHFNPRGMETFPKKGMETFRFFTATCYQTINDTRPYIYIYGKANIRINLSTGGDPQGTLLVTKSSVRLSLVTPPIPPVTLIGYRRLIFSLCQMHC